VLARVNAQSIAREISEQAGFKTRWDKMAGCGDVADIGPRGWDAVGTERLDEMKRRHRDVGTRGALERWGETLGRGDVGTGGWNDVMTGRTDAGMLEPEQRSDEMG
jgi:hypothetical protein